LRLPKRWPLFDASSVAVCGSAMKSGFSTSLTPAKSRSTVRTAQNESSAATIRPPASYTNALKKAQLVQWCYADRNPSHYEEDHLVSLEIGRLRVHTEPMAATVVAGSQRCPVENAWHKKVCNGMLTLRQAQRLELAYKRKNG
jgi:hypothetical protein